MRMLTWNTDAATLTTAKSAAKWKAFLEFSPDIAMLQEVNDLPPTVYDHYHVDCVFKHYGKREPTFWGKSQRHKSPIHQLDYVYANAPMLARLHNVTVGGMLPEYDRWLSDHLPIVCDFR